MRTLGTHIALVRSLERRPSPIITDRPLASIALGAVLGGVILGSLYWLDRLGW